MEFTAERCTRPPHTHPGGSSGANLKSISHRCHPILVAFVWELTIESIHLPLGCLQGGCGWGRVFGKPGVAGGEAVGRASPCNAFLLSAEEPVM